MLDPPLFSIMIGINQLLIVEDHISEDVMRAILSVLFAGFMFGAASQSLAQDDVATRDLTPEQIKAYRSGTSKQSSLQVSVGVDRKDATYARGEAVKIRLKTNEDAYVVVFDIGPSGKVTQLLPNKFQKDNLVRANKETEIPSADSKTEIKVSGEVGAELIKVIASSKPLKITPESLETSGIFVSVRGGVSELVRNLEVVSTEVSPVDKVSIVNMTIKTVASR